MTDGHLASYSVCYDVIVGRRDAVIDTLCASLTSCERQWSDEVPYCIGWLADRQTGVITATFALSAATMLDAHTNSALKFAALILDANLEIDGITATGCTIRQIQRETRND